MQSAPASVVSRGLATQLVEVKRFSFNDAIRATASADDVYDTIFF
jgi:hypothetical protein